MIEAEDVSQFDEKKLQALQSNTLVKVAKLVNIHQKLRH